MTDQRQHYLHDVVTLIQKKWGHKALRIGHQQMTKPVVSTRFPPLDGLLNGGIPRGALTEIVGSPTSGATTLALQVIAAAQIEQDAAVYLDLATAFDPDYAANCGVHFNDFLLLHPPFALSLDILFDVIASGIPGVVVFNTFPILSFSEHRQLATVLTRLHPLLRRSRCALLVLIPAFPDHKGLTPVAALRILVTREAWVYGGQELIGFTSHVTLLKYKPRREGRTITVHIPVAEGEGGEP